MQLKRLTEGAERQGLLGAFEERLRTCGAGSPAGDVAFAPRSPITVGRGPARIDVMGGIADYSGSVVFEGTLGQAAVVAFQPRTDGLLRVRSTLLEDQGKPCEVLVPLDELRRGGAPVDYEAARARLTADPAGAWAAYVLGAVVVLEREGLARLDGGAGLLLWSDVPIGVGVASSAAVEVASMYAIACGLGLQIPGERLAALAQMVENRVVGAPCGIMDQVTSALGESGKLLALRCQPCEVLGLGELPPDVAVFGISSRVEHRVGGSPYTDARVSAFMGLKVILSRMQARRMPITERSHYLCNVTPRAYREQFRDALPDSIRGDEFLRRWGPTTDKVTRVDPNKTYKVRLGAEHPIYENSRVQAFIECIERAHAGDCTALVEAGGLMEASHWSYGRNCNLGCEETDLLVRLVRRRGPEHGLFGAKITGGGSGGTVAILARKDAAPAVREIAAEYAAQTGITPDIFDSTSPGAYAFGARQYVLE